MLSNYRWEVIVVCWFGSFYQVEGVDWCLRDGPRAMPRDVLRELQVSQRGLGDYDHYIIMGKCVGDDCRGLMKGSRVTDVTSSHTRDE